MQNAGLVLALCFVQWVLVERWSSSSVWRQILSGVAFGAAASAAMTLAITVAPGVIFDGRTVVLSMAALFGGPVTAVVSACFAGGYRAWIGGDGMLVGIAVIATASLVGQLVRQLHDENLYEIGALRLLLAGLAVHLLAALWFLALPIDFTVDSYLALTVPYVVILTPATAITGLLLREIEKVHRVDTALREGHDRFAALFEGSAVAILEEDVTLPIRRIERLREEGVVDLRRHLDEHPDLVMKLASEIRVVHANAAAIEFFAARNALNLRQNISKTFTPEATESFVELLCALWRGESRFQRETVFAAMDGTRRPAVISLPLPTDGLAARRVPVSIADISLRIEAQERERQLQSQLETAALGAVGAVAATIEKRDPYTSGHQSNVARLSVEIARRLGWDEFKIEGLRLGAMLHDIGKISVPAEILNRPGRLTEHEFGIIKDHPQTGYEILEPIDFPWPVQRMIVQHHERLDGSGYPAGLSGDEIIDEARVIAVADVLDAITSHRPYRPGRGVNVALEEIQRGRGNAYDPAVVDAALDLVRRDGFRWISAPATA